MRRERAAGPRRHGSWFLAACRPPRPPRARRRRSTTRPTGCGGGGSAGDGASSGWVEQELAGGAACLEVLVGAPDLREPVGGAFHDAQVALRGHGEELGERVLHHVAAAEAVHQPEPNDSL